MSDPDWKPNWDDYEEDLEDGCITNEKVNLEPKPKRKRRSVSPAPPPKRTAPSNASTSPLEKTSPPKTGEGCVSNDENGTVPASLTLSDEITGIANPPLKIASFNIQVFGERKMGKSKVAETLMKILQRYDVILILEIRDSSQTALATLVTECNNMSPQNPFKYVASARLGRTSSKEQYGFMYRVKKLEVKSTFQFDDGVDDGTDVFQREPFAVRFYSPTTELEDFAIIATHTDPDEATKEVGALHKVYDSAKKHWGGLEDILIAGDFNADEGYVKREDWKKIPLRQDKRFKWLIEDSTDTTTKNTDRAYDRFVVAGNKLIQSVVPERTGVFRFDTAFNLTYEEAIAVSDHYPIEMSLCGKANRELQKELGSSLQVKVIQRIPVDKESDVRHIYRCEYGPSSAHFTTQTLYDNSKMTDVIATRTGVTDVMATLLEFQLCFPNVLHHSTLDMVQAYMQGSSIFKPTPDHVRPYVYGLAGNMIPFDGSGDNAETMDNSFDVVVQARIVEPRTVTVTVAMVMN